MPGKKVVVEIDGTGKLHCEYDGFIANTCFDAAQELQHYLSTYGVDVDVVRVDPKKDEVEVRRLENQQSVRG